MATQTADAPGITRTLTDDFLAAGRLQNIPGFQSVQTADVSEQGYSGAALVPAKIPEDAELRQHAKLFKAALVDYQKSIDEDTSQLLAPDFSTGYKQVLATLIEADKNYHKDKKDCLNTLEKCCQGFHKYEKSFESWMRLLPTESWQGSLICGGLKILFGAIARVHTVRLDIGQVLEYIPIVMANVDSYLRVYQDRLLQQNLIKELFVTMVDLLQHCVVFFTKRWYSKVGAAVLRGSQYGSELAEKFGRFKQVDEWIQKQTTTMLHENVDGMSRKLDSVEKKMLFGAMLLQDTRDLLLGQEKTHRDILEALQAKIRIEERARAERIYGQSVLVLRERFEVSLDYDMSRCLKDQKRCLAMMPTNYPGARERTLWIVKCKELERWTNSNHCELLLVNANEVSHGRGESAVSMFSAAFLHSLDEKSQNSIAVFWFGGQNPEAEPEDVVVGLLAQLLNKGRATPRSQDMNRIATQELNDLDLLIDIFIAWLRLQLDQTTVYLVIDSISCYEDSSRRYGILALYAMLSDLVEEQSTRYPLKVLLTSPTKSRAIGVYDDERSPQVLNVPVVV